MTTALAIWGAILATVSLGWQLFREWRRSRPRIVVSIEVSADIEQASIIDLNDPRPEPLEYWLTIEVVAHGDIVEYLRELEIEEPGVEELEAGDGNFKCGFTLIDRATPDEQIPARGRLVRMVEASDLADFDLPSGIIARARFASGLVVKSKLTKFDIEIVEHVRSWNRQHRPERSPLPWLEQFPD